MTILSSGLRLLVLVLLTVTPLTLALLANLAGIVDWHKPLIGPSLLDPTPPSLINDRIIAITRKNVLAVLNAESGDVIWRHLLEDDDPVVSYHVRNDGELNLESKPDCFSRSASVWTFRCQSSPVLVLIRSCDMGTNFDPRPHFSAPNESSTPRHRRCLHRRGRGSCNRPQ